MAQIRRGQEKIMLDKVIKRTSVIYDFEIMGEELTVIVDEGILLKAITEATLITQDIFGENEINRVLIKVGDHTIKGKWDVKYQTTQEVVEQGFKKE